MSRIVERGTLMKVLDHGYIRIVDFMGTDESIIEAARMSTGKGFISWDPYWRCDACGDVGYGNQEGHINKSCEKHKMVFSPNGDLGLLDTLWRKKHATPFEMGELVIEVQAPIMVFREWHRHRTQSYNEFSARYSVMPNLHYLPEKSRIQKQSSANKQGSAEAMGDEFSSKVLEDLTAQQQDVYTYYENWVEDGLAKEVARLNTPVSRYSKMRAKGNLRNWFQFLNLRARPDAQYEIRQYAEELGKMISWLWPKAYELFEEYDLYGASFSRTELRTIRSILAEAGSDTQFYTNKANAEKLGLSGGKLNEFLAKLQFGGEKIL